MAVTLELELATKVNRETISETKEEIKQAYSEVGRDVATVWEKAWSSSLDSTGKTIKTSLGSSVIEGITSGVDGIGDVWSKACSNLAKSTQKIRAHILCSPALTEAYRIIIPPNSLLVASSASTAPLVV